MREHLGSTLSIGHSSRDSGISVLNTGVPEMWRDRRDI